MAKEAAQSNQKLKILHLQQMLWRETDAKHGLTMTQIIARLEEQGISAERKSIYRDLNALKDFGLPVITLNRSPVEYAVARKDLSFRELMTLINLVQSSPYISENKSKEFTNGLRGLASTYEQQLLNKRISAVGRVSNQNDSTLGNVDDIHLAMQLKRKISFVYCTYGTDLQLHPLNNGVPYVLTPVRVVFVNSKYYLAAWSDEDARMHTYRVDRMEELQLNEGKATSNAQIGIFEMADFENQDFGMVDDEPVEITLQVVASGMDEMVDMFGKSIKTSNVTEDSCCVHVPVRITSMFHGWLAAMKGSAELIAPLSVVEAHDAWVKSVAGE